MGTNRVNLGLHRSSRAVRLPGQDSELCLGVEPRSVAGARPMGRWPVNEILMWDLVFRSKSDHEIAAMYGIEKLKVTALREFYGL